MLKQLTWNWWCSVQFSFFVLLPSGTNMNHHVICVFLDSGPCFFSPIWVQILFINWCNHLFIFNYNSSISCATRPFLTTFFSFVVPRFRGASCAASSWTSWASAACGAACAARRRRCRRRWPRSWCPRRPRAAAEWAGRCFGPKICFNTFFIPKNEKKYKHSILSFFEFWVCLNWVLMLEVFYCYFFMCYGVWFLCDASDLPRVCDWAQWAPKLIELHRITISYMFSQSVANGWTCSFWVLVFTDFYWNGNPEFVDEWCIDPRCI